MSENARKAVLEVTFDGDSVEAAMSQTMTHASACGAAIPMAHRFMERAGHRWGATLIVIPEDDEVARLAARVMERPSPSICRIGVSRVQPTIDMLYPKKDGLRRELKMLQFIEYVYAKPQSRDDYLRCQYEVSGPAMRGLWERDLVGRFIGFETEDVFFCKDGFPNWDLIHLSGMTLWQMARCIPRLRGAFNERAIASGRGSKEAVFSKWNDQRDNLKAPFKQARALSRQSDVLARRLPGAKTRV